MKTAGFSLGSQLLLGPRPLWDSNQFSKHPRRLGLLGPESVVADYGICKFTSMHVLRYH